MGYNWQLSHGALTHQDVCVHVCVLCVCVCREEAALTYRPTMTFRNSTSTPLMRQARLNPVCVCVCVCVW